MEKDESLGGFSEIFRHLTSDDVVKNEAVSLLRQAYIAPGQKREHREMQCAMSKELELYKAFIDGLVERKDSMTALWVTGDGFPKTEDNKAKNDLLATLTPEQKGVLAEMLQDEHIAGIHDTLAYINEMMDLEGLELHQDGF